MNDIKDAYFEYKNRLCCVNSFTGELSVAFKGTWADWNLVFSDEDVNLALPRAADNLSKLENGEATQFHAAPSNTMKEYEQRGNTLFFVDSGSIRQESSWGYRQKPWTIDVIEAPHPVDIY